MKRSLELAEKLIHQSYLEKEEYMELLGSYQGLEQGLVYLVDRL